MYTFLCPAVGFRVEVCVFLVDFALKTARQVDDLAGQAV